MKREIKFKAKRIDNGEWVYGSLVFNSDESMDIICYADRDSESYEWYEVIPETVCQFTGLKDKNGVDIYEGDFFQFKQSIKNNVIFRQGSFGYDSFNGAGNGYINFVELSNQHFKYDYKWRGQYIEVTGNKHN